MAIHDDGNVDQFCAQHNGNVWSFDALKERLDDIDQYEKVYSKRLTNWVKVGKQVLPTTPGAILSTGSLVVGALPGALGRAIPGVGAVLLLSTAKGMLVRTATSRVVFKEDHFRVQKLAVGGKHALIVVDGFLSQGRKGATDWFKHHGQVFCGSTWYHLDWASSSLMQVPIATSQLDVAFFRKAAARTEEAAKGLAQLIKQTPGWTFTLAGHSLGGAVVFRTLLNLQDECKGRVNDVYLLGAATTFGAEEWAKAANVVDGRIVNAWSSHDDVLRYLYKGSTLGDDAAGHKPIASPSRTIVNIDASGLVKSHVTWKDHFDSIVRMARSASSPPGHCAE